MNFNPETFLDQTVDGEMDTKRVPIPIDDYIAVIEKIAIRTPKESTIMDVFFAIDSPEVAAELERDKLSSKGSYFLDLTPDGGLDRGTGKNVQLGKLRAAVGQNGPNAWAPSMLIGQALKVKVTHRPNADTGDIHDEVKTVAALG